MTILEGDIKLLASRVMDDVPEGGGGPTGTVIPYGGSNAVFGDVTEAARAGGNVSIRQVHMGVLTPTTDALMGANVILSRLPTDPNVAVTLAKCNLFARRTEIALTIANYLIKGPEWNGYLLEDHVAGQRALQIMHPRHPRACNWPHPRAAVPRGPVRRADPVRARHPHHHRRPHIYVFHRQ